MDEIDRIGDKFKRKLRELNDELRLELEQLASDKRTSPETLERLANDYKWIRKLVVKNDNITIDTLRWLAICDDPVVRQRVTEHRETSVGIPSFTMIEQRENQ